MQREICELLLATVMQLIQWSINYYTALLIVNVRADMIFDVARVYAVPII